MLTLNVCGLKSKLLSDEFVVLRSSYDVVYMCETRCDDADMNIVGDKMGKIGFDIVYKNRHALSRFKSGGLLIAVRKMYKLSGNKFEMILKLY